MSYDFIFVTIKKELEHKMIKVNDKNVFIDRFKWGNLVLFCLLCIWVVVSALYSFNSVVQQTVVPLVDKESANFTAALLYFRALTSIIAMGLLFFGCSKLLFFVTDYQNSEVIRHGVIMVSAGLILFGASGFIKLMIGSNIHINENPTTKNDIFPISLYLENLIYTLGLGYIAALKTFIITNVLLALFATIEICRFRNLEYLAKRYVKDYKKYNGDVKKMNVYSGDVLIHPNEMGKNLAKYFV